MKSRSLIIAGCLLALGIASCDTKTDEEPALNDSTIVRDTTPPPVDVADTTLIEKTRVDTAIITQDTTVKAGKTVTTDTDTKTPGKSTSGSKSTGSKTTGSGTPTTADPAVRGSEVRRGEGSGTGSEGSGTESRPRR